MQAGTCLGRNSDVLGGAGVFPAEQPCGVAPQSWPLLAPERHCTDKAAQVPMGASLDRLGHWGER